MNVLLFTVVLVLMMSIMTYTRFETYRNFEGMRALFQHYMEEKERDGANKL